MSGPMQWTSGGMVPANVTKTSRVAPVDPDDDDLDELEDDVAPSPRPATPARRVAVRPAKPLAPKDVVRLAKARLREVEAELKRMRRLELERAELQRLLAAAKSGPRAVVRELPKRSAG